MAYEPPVNTRSNPATGGVVVDVSVSDQTLTYGARFFYVGTGGNVKVDTTDGDTLTFNNVQDGSIMPVMVKKFYNAGTTATNMVALW